METLPFLSVTTTWASPVASLVTLKQGDLQRDSLFPAIFSYLVRCGLPGRRTRDIKPPPEEGLYDGAVLADLERLGLAVSQ